MEKKASVFGKYLKELRKRKGVSLKAVEDATGISNAYLSQLETGARRKLPNPDRLRLIADYYNVTVPELLEKAGYFDPIDIQETYENKIKKSFTHILTDPNLKLGSRVNPDDLSIDVKRFIIELYHRSLYLSSFLARPYIEGTFYDSDKDKIRTLRWITNDVVRNVYNIGKNKFIRYRVKVTCIESEGESLKPYDNEPVEGTEKVTQTATGEGETVVEIERSKGYETPLLLEATDLAVKKALTQIKGTDWAFIMKPWLERVVLQA